MTPDPKGHHKDRILREAAFVGYLAHEDKLKYVCGPIPTKHTGEYVVIDDDLILIVSEFARGEPLDFFKPRWMSDKELIHAWGKWFALLHQASREFEAKQSELSKSIQCWDQIHECVMKGAPVHAEDIAVIDDPSHYGVIHGDFNTTNFHFIDDENQLSVFDWDQAHRGWYLWDLA